MLSFFIVCIICFVRADDAPIVNTAKGTIRGVRSEDGNYNMFMGIPYAKVDEANPFGPATPYPPFDKIFEANDDSSKCPQAEQTNGTFTGDLDCLRLNIYVPTNVDSNSRLAVYVYIYGGLFNYGCYSRYTYGPKFLVRHNIILAIMNYRLGPYGFMCLDIPEVPGNQGLKDQILALRWIQSNIIAFGGNPDKVTIGGNSAGACAVDYHLHRDNNAEKLYNQAIIESGARLGVPYNNPVKDAPIVLARYYNFSTDDVYKAIKFLASLPPKYIITAEMVLGLYIRNPCLEKTFPGVESYATVEWFEQKPTVANMSFIIGNNGDEVGISFGDHVFDTTFNTQNEKFQAMNDMIERFYIVENRLDVDKITSDMTFLYPNYRNIREFIENGASAIYLYNFTYVGNKNFSMRKSNINSNVVLHADELGYLFDLGFAPEEPTAKDQLMIDQMTTLWTNFIKYGDPNPETTELINVKWEPVTKTEMFKCMHIDSNLTLTASTFAEKFSSWDTFYEKNYRLSFYWTGV